LKITSGIVWSPFAEAGPVREAKQQENAVAFACPPLTTLPLAPYIKRLE
jgi:hypothetical protein